MVRQAVTFDFHNTLAACPEWFELEARHLASSLLAWRAAAPVFPSIRISRRRLTPGTGSYDARSWTMAKSSPRKRVCTRSLPRCSSIFPSKRSRTGSRSRCVGCLAGATPIPGAVEAVRAIAQERRVGIVSSAVYHPFLEWTLATFGILEAFAVIVTSASAGFHNRAPSCTCMPRSARRRAGADGPCRRLAALRRRRQPRGYGNRPGCAVMAPIHGGSARAGPDYRDAGWGRAGDSRLLLARQRTMTARG